MQTLPFMVNDYFCMPEAMGQFDHIDYANTHNVWKKFVFALYHWNLSN